MQNADIKCSIGSAGGKRWVNRLKSLITLFAIFTKFQQNVFA